MDAPPVQYVTTSDGLSIAYCVSGHGTPLIFLPGAFLHGQLAWQYPGLQDWLRGLSQRFQLVQIDPRGFGMSSRNLGDTLAREDYLKDIEAVVDHLGLDRVLIVAASSGAELAAEYALRHPDQVIALILGTSMVSAWPTALFDTLPEQNWEAFLHAIVPRDRDLDERKRIVDLHKQDKDQQNYIRRSHLLWSEPDVFAGYIHGVLTKLQTRTLVLHSRDYPLIGVEESIKKAQYTRGRLVVIDGTDVWGDATQGILAIESFLAELPREEASRAPLAVLGHNGAGLSARELEVLRLIAAGRSNAQIAEALVISESTVAKHVSSILAKTGAANRTEAAVYARDKGLA
jgi:pimeloyl-ACP methyl ester carboxylesterase/DNA-binding CsgD family transcriptional regulator